MIRMFDGFEHWTIGGVGNTLGVVDDTSSPSAPSPGMGGNLGQSGYNQFWYGYGGTASMASGLTQHCLSLVGDESYIFGNLDGRSYWVVGARFQQSSLFDGWSSAVIRIRECVSFSDWACVSVDSSGYVNLWWGDREVLAARSDSAVVSTGQDYYLEFKFDVTSGRKWTLEARLDGIVVATATGDSVPIAVPNPANQFMLCGPRLFDDFYAVDGQADGTGGNADYLGPVIVEQWIPDEDSETGAMGFDGGSPPNSGTFGLSGFGIETETPPGVATGGNLFAAEIASRLPTGDTDWIGCNTVSDPLVFGVASASPEVPTRVMAVCSYIVAENDGDDATIMSFGQEIPSTLPPWYSDAADITLDVADAWQLAYGHISPVDALLDAWTTESVDNSRWTLKTTA